MSTTLTSAIGANWFKLKRMTELLFSNRKMVLSEKRITTTFILCRAAPLIVTLMNQDSLTLRDTVTFPNILCNIKSSRISGPLEMLRVSLAKSRQPHSTLRQTYS